MYKKSWVHSITKVLLEGMFYIGIICCILVPIIVKSLRDFYGYSNEVLLPFMMILFISGFFAVYIIYNLKIMFKTLVLGNPFVEQNVTCFRKMALSCLFIAFVYVIKCIFWFTIATAIIVVVFMIGCLFCLTLKDIFKQAIYFKEENDLTV